MNHEGTVVQEDGELSPPGDHSHQRMEHRENEREWDRNKDRMRDRPRRRSR